MNGPLVIAVTAALGGFGFWVWLTGPGTSVPNALLALLCAILSGRVAWRLATRHMLKNNAPAEAERPHTGPPPSTGSRASPPADAEP
ncbi:hypothetical protein [Roseomonas chloroacetimidivorans]|jgi:heme exporter protein D|uniref:hypothetical protein n=1 Tax=Roseomonas chloroacetimidivorans TaxID=1766656 RepID=UPI003C77F5BA